MMTKEELERFNERNRLFATSENLLSNVDKYQRMRYEREIEASEYVKLLQSGFTHKIAVVQARNNVNVLRRT